MNEGYGGKDLRKHTETKPKCDFCKSENNVWLQILLTCENCRKKFRFKVKHAKEKVYSNERRRK